MTAVDILATNQLSPTSPQYPLTLPHPGQIEMTPVLNMPITPAKPLGDPVVVIRHMSKTYKLAGSSEPVLALKDIHLAPGSEFYPIRRGEFVILRGPSGGGKTTLLNCIGAIDAPTSGEIEILGDVLMERSSDEFLSELRLKKIGFVFQTFNLLATLSAFENVELPMIILGKVSPEKRRARVMRLLESKLPIIEC
jgi:putative ABC transport system ATP-binding protein